MNPLNRSLLHQQAAGAGSTISLPSYDPAAVTPGIVHIGLGGFHRAHFARYTHDLMEQDPCALSWGIIGAGLRPSDRPLLETLNAQECLYTLVERDIHGEKRTLIGSIMRAIDASQASAALLETIADPSIRIVSITVSEHGYHLDSATRKLNSEDPAIKRDLASPRAPSTLLGILVESFRRRRADKNAPFTALSCDNIRDNGDVLRGAVLAFAQRVDPDLAAWITEHGRFPCAMVDRITPVPNPEQIAAFRDETGSPDEAPIFAEAFRQWVIEDSFSNGRPDWDRVGAQFVIDVSPYEKMKLRLLNASHLATAGLGSLAGYETVRQTIEDPFIRRYMERLMECETAQTLPAIPGVDLAAYQRNLIERFANPAIHDRLQRINADAPVNLLLDPLSDRLAAEASIDLLSLGLAAWLKRVTLESSLPVEGRQLGKSELQLQSRARRGDTPISFLNVSEIFGAVGTHPRLLASVEHWLSALDSRGAAGTLQDAARAGLI
jgi:mannitol-1-phosphate/altronate dehydrogenase